MPQVVDTNRARELIDAGAQLVEVLSAAQYEKEHIAGAVNIPLGELRSRLGELPRDREIHVICRSGQRAYYAARVLAQNGFAVRTISGGMLSRTVLQPA